MSCTVVHTRTSKFLLSSLSSFRFFNSNGAALGAAGALSDDETSIFVAGGSTTFNSVNAMTGNVQWTDSNSESLFISEPKISRGIQNTVYAIEVRYQ